MDCAIGLATNLTWVINNRDTIRHPTKVIRSYTQVADMSVQSENGSEFQESLQLSSSPNVTDETDALGDAAPASAQALQPVCLRSAPTRSVS